MESRRQLGFRFWIECVLALASSVLLVATLITRTWIEEVFKVDLDKSSGSLEWIIVTVVLLVTVGSVTLATAEYRRRVVAV